MVALDIEQTYRQVNTPMLAIAGENDIQCLPSDVAKIAEIVPATVTSYVVVVKGARQGENGSPPATRDRMP